MRCPSLPPTLPLLCLPRCPSLPPTLPVSASHAAPSLPPTLPVPTAVGYDDALGIERSFLFSDVAVECHTARHGRLVRLAAALVVCWPLSMLCVVFGVLYQIRNGADRTGAASKEGEALSRAASFLHREYRRDPRCTCACVHCVRMCAYVCMCVHVCVHVCMCVRVCHVSSGPEVRARVRYLISSLGIAQPCPVPCHMLASCLCALLPASTRLYLPLPAGTASTGR